MQSFKSKISEIEACLLGNKLPGLTSQLKMAPVSRLTFQTENPPYRIPQKSAVLILFYPKNNRTNLAMIKRATDNTIHSDQISFPGGKVEASDSSLIHTALREANEEVGLDPDSVMIIGQLSKLYIPPSNFDVYPIIGVTYVTPIFSINHEVDKLLEVDLETLINPKTRKHKTIKHRSGNEFNVPCYYIQEEIIWGATAMIVAELVDIIRSSEYKS
ncbi:MAG: CoA pyrophosphatase [Bacteroidetes bacterium]|nr:CoA pyrophosphatase [Bacteroidota bacterium]MBL6944393.1 CoA pyrophosphatase [Bacteroidales bacterium]